MPAKKTPPREPIRFDGKLPKLTAERQLELNKRADGLKDVRKKTEFAQDLSRYILVRLDDEMRSTASSKVVQDLARIAVPYVDFAFREEK